MEEEEEMKTQCFGGDYMGEVFDQMLKRMNFRRQKRWWNAYMLFYTRLDVEENSLMKSFNELSLCKFLKYFFNYIKKKKYTEINRHVNIIYLQIPNWE